MNTGGCEVDESFPAMVSLACSCVKGLEGYNRSQCGAGVGLRVI